MTRDLPAFTVKLAQTDDDLRAAQRLRYKVFVTEMGGDGPLVDHEVQLEVDTFDAHAHHLLLCDNRRSGDDQVVGVYRLMTQAAAAAVGQFYCESEYDLTPLYQSGKRLLELGRSCLHPDYRGGMGLMQMWSGLAEFVDREGIDLLFGVASFPGTDIAALAGPLSLLHQRHLAPPELRVTARGAGAIRMDQIAPAQVDPVAAMRATPALIKGYLRLGGVVGEGAFIDKAFNTVDVCLILDTDVISAMQRNIYSRGQGLG
ncbi:GNAT family N-acyltransferase [Yoonia sp.]|uniref:GNAT family N-acetyltransferase n=1 Tax=Yoonia sp. TaxID=2212373 RepID=UPI0019F1374F|nr:GNAT family N-acyltransferase [Yoonia sp.]MBE0413816.1 GNAT family N-acetyltransferase [Yoonia sp.]